MLSLVLAALVIKSLQPIGGFTVDVGTTDIVNVTYARDSVHEYVTTPNGLYRWWGGLMTSDPAHYVAVHDDKVYYAQGTGIEASTSPAHTLLRMDGKGEMPTSTPLDAALRDCAVPPCGYLIPTLIKFGPAGQMFVNAGGNVLASADEGASWYLLYGLAHQGKPTSQVCPVKFELVGNHLVMGGECPLDVGWIRRGRLKPNLIEWEEEPQPVVAPELENRNVQFIRHIGNGVVFAGIEGALLKSTDSGATFRFVIHYPLEAEDRYPYIAHMALSSRNPQLMVVGGFDKKNAVGYLAVSYDAGETWLDVSDLVGTPFVAGLYEDRSGRLLVWRHEGLRLTLAELVLGERVKRRAVR